MWNMTTHGFTSAVMKRDKPGVLTVRSRDRESLEHVCEVLGITRKKAIFMELPSDYPYRMIVSKEGYKDYLCATVDAITYDNFKDEATVVRGKTYHDALMQVWVAMLALTPTWVREKNDDAWKTVYAKQKWMET